MKFNEVLKDYKNSLSCTQQELANACGLSPTVMSRYLSGARIPGTNSDKLEEIAKGIVTIALSKDLQDINYEEVFSKLSESIGQDEVSDFSAKLDYVLNKYNIKTSDLSKNLPYDASFISRIRNGKRVPKDIGEFITLVTDYISNNVDNADSNEILGILSGDSAIIKDSQNQSNTKVEPEINPTETTPKDSGDITLNELRRMVAKRIEGFDLTSYKEANHINSIQPSHKFIKLKNTTEYFGPAGLQNAILDFIKYTAIQNDTKNAFVYSDIPINIDDQTFRKKLLYGLWMLVNNGINTQVILPTKGNLKSLSDNLGILIPLYKTGLFNTRILDTTNSEVFGHTYMTSSISLIGNCLMSDIPGGRYILSPNKELAEYYSQWTEHLLNLATPIIY